ncbi:MAG: hypothetical protein JWN34_2251 [Bryobacterales bacterium]|nr:hypothetical protein [Bryobacterales bacterium]
MIQTTIKGTDKLKGFGSGSDDLFSRMQMERLAQFSRDTVVARIRKGIGSDGSPMPALKGGNSRIFVARVNGKARFESQTYAGRKSKAGMQPLRDLYGTGKQGGHMLNNLTVRSVTPDSAKIAFTSRDGRSKAMTNEKRAPFLGFAPQDVEAIKAKAADLFRSGIQGGAMSLPKIIREFRKRAA